LKSSDTIADTTATTIDVSTIVAKAELLETAPDLNGKYGCLIIDSATKDKLRDVVEQLEGVSEFPTDPSGLVGDWTLLLLLLLLLLFYRIRHHGGWTFAQDWWH
jgi:hypothetical protein